MVKPIPDCSGYFADEQGNIYSSLSKSKVRENSGLVKLSPQPTKRGGHLRVKVVAEGKRNGRSVLVHHLVLKTFVGPQPPGKIGLHKDDDPLNNTVSNLQWGSHAQNRSDLWKNFITLKRLRTFLRKRHPGILQKFESLNTGS